MNPVRCGAFGVAAILAAGSAEACKLPKALAGAPELAKPPVRLMWRVAGGPIRVGKAFAIDVAACLTSGKAVRRLRVDADMPAHGHGMNYKPSRKKLGPTRSRFEGFVFHMPGTWRITFDVYGPEGSTRLTTTVDVTR